MRRRKPAPHGFAVNGNLNKNKRVEFDVPYLLLAPRQPWEPCGQACSLQAVHWLPEGLADYNPRSASPSDVWANDSAYHNTPPKVVAKRETTPSFRSKCIAQSQQHKPPSLKREAACVRLVMALFPKFVHNKLLVARSGGNVPAWLVFTFQAARRTFLFPRSPYSPGKRPESFRL